MKTVLLGIAIFLGFVLQAGSDNTKSNTTMTVVSNQPTNENVTRLILFKLNITPGSVEEADFKKKTLSLAADTGVKEMGWLKIEGGQTEFTHGVRIVFYNRAAIEPYVQSKAHREYIRDVWKPVVGAAQLLDYTEPDIAR